VLNGLEVAGRALDAEAEEVAKTSYVAAGGADLMEDAVLPQSLGPERGVLPGEGVSCGNETGAVRRLMSRCGLMLLGQVLER